MRKPVAARSKLLGVKGDALKTATAVNLETSRRTSATRPAVERYTGVLYDALDYSSLAANDRRRFDQQVVICSGLWGVVSPRDLIPDYKLKMGATLAGLGRLSAWWREPLCDAMEPVMSGRVVWNLLPNEHAASLEPLLESTKPRTVITVQFLDEVERGGATTLVRVNHWNKLLKGALVRHVVHHQVIDPPALEQFVHPLGYRFEPDLTEVADRGMSITLVKRLER